MHRRRAGLIGTVHILILGIGNKLLSDEGAGIQAMQHLAAYYAGDPDIECVDGGTLSFTLAVPISACDALIVIDAAMIDGPAGSVGVFEDEAMEAFLGANRKSSVHEVSLIDLVTIARLTESWPQRRALVGIRPLRVDWGEALTPEVAAGLDAASAAARELIAFWRTQA